MSVISMSERNLNSATVNYKSKYELESIRKTIDKINTIISDLLYKLTAIAKIYFAV